MILLTGEMILAISTYNFWENHFSVIAGNLYASWVSPKVSTAATGKAIHFIFGNFSILFLIFSPF
jgi:hypothetical protein